tara:strand:+ start:764 stop:1525 length:762 start_codon:yes stop_codon:yes gene_type:complete
LKFTIDSKELQNALDSMQVRGKHLTTSGFGNSNIGTYVYLSLEGNVLKLYNGDSTFMVILSITVEGETNGTTIVDSNSVIQYLKTCTGNVSISVSDFVSITQTNKVRNMPRVILHPNMDSITNIKNLVSHIVYEAQPSTLFSFGKKEFEGSCSVSHKQFKDAIKACELINSGIYKLDFNDTLSIASRNLNDIYSESITPVFSNGEPATIEFSGPLYAFFNADQILNVYMRDEFPLLIVANDRMLLKAPYVNGE